jgi:hypothetical protein
MPMTSNNHQLLTSPRTVSLDSAPGPVSGIDMSLTTIPAFRG